FAADVEDVGSLIEQGVAMVDGRARIEVAASVGEGIGRDVEHPHDERALAERQHAAAEIPLEAGAHGGHCIAAGGNFLWLSEICYGVAEIRTILLLLPDCDFCNVQDSAFQSPQSEPSQE